MFRAELSFVNDGLVFTLFNLPSLPYDFILAFAFKCHPNCYNSKVCCLSLYHSQECYSSISNSLPPSSKKEVAYLVLNMKTRTSKLYTFIQKAPMMENNTEITTFPRNTDILIMIMLRIFPVPSLEDFNLLANQCKCFQAP